MKKIRYPLFTIIVLLLLSSCGANDGGSDNTSISNTSAVATYEQYAGTWAQEEIGWLNGGVMLDVSVDGGMFQATYLEITAAPISDQAIIDIAVPVSKIQDNIVETEFENDGWDNSGTIRITFDNDQILCKISDIHYVGENWGATWQVTETTSVLVKMDNAHDLVEYDLADYYEMFPEENPDNWNNDDSSAAEPVPYGDLSKASGILASIGMTEDEFRSSCTPLQKTVKSGTALLHFFDTELLNSIRDYPGQYAGSLYHFSYFEVEQKGSSVDGYLYYLRSAGDHPIQIFDFRDDPYSPTISEGDKISAYVIFGGSQLNGLGQDVLCFNLISCDKL